MTTVAFVPTVAMRNLISQFQKQTYHTRCYETVRKGGISIPGNQPVLFRLSLPHSGSWYRNTKKIVAARESNHLLIEFTSARIKHAKQKKGPVMDLFSVHMIVHPLAHSLPQLWGVADPGKKREKTIVIVRNGMEMFSRHVSNVRVGFIYIELPCWQTDTRMHGETMENRPPRNRSTAFLHHSPAECTLWSTVSKLSSTLALLNIIYAARQAHRNAPVPVFIAASSARLRHRPFGPVPANTRRRDRHSVLMPCSFVPLLSLSDVITWLTVE